STAVEYAGDTGDRQVDEKAAPGTGRFLAELAQGWEAEAQRVRETGARLVLLRQSLGLGREGGTLAALPPAYRSGFGGTRGPGGQWFSWIHINDAARLTYTLWIRKPLQAHSSAPVPILLPVASSPKYSRTPFIAPGSFPCPGE